MEPCSVPAPTAPRALTVLGLSFAAAGAAKLADLPPMRRLFGRYGYTPHAMWAIGWAEVAGTALLLLPPTRRLGAAALTTIAAGGLSTHLKARERSFALNATVLLLLAGRELLAPSATRRAEPRRVRSRRG